MVGGPDVGDGACESGCRSEAGELEGISAGAGFQPQPGQIFEKIQFAKAGQ
jgi:hypothetical protein